MHLQRRVRQTVVIVGITYCRREHSKEGNMLTAQDLKGALAIMPTPAKEGADRLDASNTVDLDETARLSESLVHDGATGIMALGTMGECATTSQDDYEDFVDCLLRI